MATYFVDGKNGNDSSGNGSTSNPWKTLGKAESKISAGDVVKMRTATYKEVLKLSTANVTWKADDGHTPALDGGYHEGLMSGGQLPPPQGYLPGDAFGSMISIAGDGITIDGLAIQNIAGRAVGITGNRVTVRNCRMDFCYAGGISANGTQRIAATLIENNTITRCSVKYYDPNRPGAGPDQVAGTINLIDTDNAIIRHNIVAYNFGEGINAGKGSTNALVEGNVVHTCHHIHLYINRSRNTTIRNNFVYHLLTKEFLGDDKAPTGIAVGDEGSANAQKYANSSGGIIYNNIVVGMGINFQVRNNAHNYDTQLLDSYIAFNTFVAGEKTRTNIEIKGNQRGREHRRSIFENNIIDNGRGRISNATGDISGITFRNNLWASPPDQSMRGTNDRIGDPRLSNPQAPISGTSPGSTNADPFNYRLTKNSALAIGLATDGGASDGFRPPAVTLDFFNNSRDNQPDIGAHEFAGQAQAVSANFSIGPGQQTGKIPHTVDFTDRSTAASTIVSWAWDFGDGSTSAERNPAHTYLQPGTYTVSLKIVTQDSQTDTVVEPDLITALPDMPDVTPESFRRFLLIETSTTGIIAFGVQYPDLSCVLLWNAEPFHTLNYASIEDVARALTGDGKSSLLWLDPIEEPYAAEANPA